jgi:hypothetical protein
MKKIVLIVAAIVLVAAIAYVGMRFINRGTDINGVTTMAEKNTVIMNVKPGKDFAGGSGKLTVGDGKRIHVEYALNAGSFDLAFSKENNALAVLKSANLDNLTDAGDVFGKSGVSGKGNFDLEAAPGEYTLYFKPHDTNGTATVTTKAH